MKPRSIGTDAPDLERTEQAPQVYPMLYENPFKHDSMSTSN